MIDRRSRECTRQPVGFPARAIRSRQQASPRVVTHRERRRSKAAPQAFLAAVDPHLEAIHNIARGLVRDTHHAEDLFQETCLRAFTGFPHWRGGDIRSWLVAILMNGWRMDLRRAQRRPVEEFGDPPESAASVTAATSVEDSVLTRLDADVVFGALADLSEMSRICVVLSDMGGLTAQEVADVLECPRGTVLARVHRARRVIAQSVVGQVAVHDR